MKVSRFDSLGIKQVLRLEWLQRTANLLLAGMSVKDIRMDLHEFLSQRKGSGEAGDRSEKTREFAVNNLIKIWVTPDPDLIPFRDISLSSLQDDPKMALSIHWGMISAAYPFWYNVAKQTGRLLALQDLVTSAQIIRRLKEQYGDRQTISRVAQYIIRSFISWNVLEDSDVHGCYKKGPTAKLTTTSQATLLFEAVLRATPDAASELGQMLQNPALFPFELPLITGGIIAHNTKRIEVLRYGANDERLRLQD